MQIICPIHAKERMEQRDVTREQVEKAISSPDIALPTHNKRRKRVMKNFGFKTLDVIFEQRGEEKIILVTAAWLKDEDRKIKG